MAGDAPNHSAAAETTEKTITAIASFRIVIFITFHQLKNV